MLNLKQTSSTVIEVSLWLEMPIAAIVAFSARAARHPSIARQISAPDCSTHPGDRGRDGMARDDPPFRVQGQRRNAMASCAAFSMPSDVRPNFSNRNFGDPVGMKPGKPRMRMGHGR